MPLLNFTDADLAILKRLVEDEKNRIQGGLTRPSTESDHLPEEPPPAPDLYIVKPYPTTGIPALDPGSAEGTASDPDDVPGVATCGVYEIQGDIDSPDLVRIPGFDLPVHNLATAAAPQDWTIAARDKFGKWLALISAAGGSLRLGEINSICDVDSTTGTGSGSVDTSGEKYLIDLYSDSSLPEQTCSETTPVFNESIDCDIIDDDTGDYLDCTGYESTAYVGTASATCPPTDRGTNYRGRCVGSLAGPTSGDLGATLSGEQIIAQDLDGRQLPIGTLVVVGQIGSLWVIVKAGLDYTKVCLLANLACGTDCQGNPVLLRTFQPVWLPDWAIGTPQAEFVP